MIRYEAQQQRENQERTRQIEEALNRAQQDRDNTVDQQEEDEGKTDDVEKGIQGPGAL
jgi:hypothetical protein